MIRILISESNDFSKTAIEILKQAGNVECKEITKEALFDSFLVYDVIVFRLGYKITADILPDKPRCKILATPVTGIDHIDTEECAKRGIKVICLKGETNFLKKVRATAELTLGITIALLRNIPSAIEHVKHGEWNRDLFRGNEIFDKTIGIVGLGRLGCIVAEYFKIMGANIIGYDPRPDIPTTLVKRVDSISDIFKMSDIISIHVAYNLTTHNLISYSLFEKAFKRPVIINTSRGGIINEDALLYALKNNLIAGAALDVINNEHNITSENELIKYAKENNNLLIVPHIGGNTYESFEKTEIFIANKIVEALKTKPEKA